MIQGTIKHHNSYNYGRFYMLLISILLAASRSTTIATTNYDIISETAPSCKFYSYSHCYVIE